MGWGMHERRDLLHILVAKPEGRRSFRWLKTLKRLLKKQSLEYGLESAGSR
jgi:hypothetical protein